LEQQSRIGELARLIDRLRELSLDILAAGGDIEAVRRNVIRLQANIKMLELNISDLREEAIFPSPPAGGAAR